MWGLDLSKWLIIRSRATGEWIVHPPRNTFWGKTTDHRSFEEARADFIRQTLSVGREHA